MATSKDGDKPKTTPAAGAPGTTTGVTADSARTDKPPTPDKASPPVPAAARSKRGGTPKPPPPKRRAAGGLVAQLDALRDALTKASEAHWIEYLEALAPRLPKVEDEDPVDPSPAARGDWVKLDRVDYTRQSEGETHQVVVFTDERRQAWAVLLDERFSALIDVGADVELAFRFDRRIHWDIVGRVAGYNVVFDRHSRPRKLPIVRVDALRRPDQFVIFHHPKKGPQVPELAETRTKLEAIQGKLRIPKAAQPRELFETLLTIVETGNFPRFVEISVESPDLRTLRRRFEQFMKAYGECGGRIVFDRYAPGASPENPGPAGDLKMFVKRTAPDGKTVSRPLTFTKGGTGWLLKTGMF